MIKLYLPYGNLKSFKGHGLVTVHWFVRDREHPIAPYAQLIQGYQQLTEAARRPAEQTIDELFTEGEFRELRSYLYDKREDLRTEILVPPISVARQDNAQNRGLIRPFGTRVEGDGGGFCKLCEQEDYPLGFTVWGYYTEPVRVAPRQVASQR